MIEMMNGQPLMWFKKRTYPFVKNDWPLLALNHSTIYNHPTKREAGLIASIHLGIWTQ
ncbi:hypothetical protein [Burkholderia phage FLC6]|nr:hypothetical protein [Burkholderia phage FLC6]